MLKKLLGLTLVMGFVLVVAGCSETTTKKTETKTTKTTTDGSAKADKADKDKDKKEKDKTDKTTETTLEFKAHKDAVTIGKKDKKDVKLEVTKAPDADVTFKGMVDKVEGKVVSAVGMLKKGETHGTLTITTDGAPAGEHTVLVKAEGDKVKGTTEVKIKVEDK